MVFSYGKRCSTALRKNLLYYHVSNGYNVGDAIAGYHPFWPQASALRGPYSLWESASSVHAEERRLAYSLDHIGKGCSPCSDHLKPLVSILRVFRTFSRIARISITYLATSPVPTAQYFRISLVANSTNSFVCSINFVKKSGPLPGSKS